MKNNKTQFDINGKTYVKREKVKSTTNRPSILTMFGVYAGISTMGTTPNRKKPSVDIVKEYKLVQKKKSKLSKRQRDWVECMFEKEYKLVENNYE